MLTKFPRPSVNANAVAVQSEVDSKEGLCSRPVLGQLNEEPVEKLCDSPRPDSYPLEYCPRTAHDSRVNQNFSDDDLFYIFQAHCMKDPVVLEKALCWGIARTPNRKAASEEIADLGKGRCWVSARLSESFKENC